ncbi:MAG: 6-carboxytetrahydropterin synthase [Planctomycetota bacterium]
MVELSRTIRFAVSRRRRDADERHRNGFGGSPRFDGLGAHYELVVKCQGEPDPKTGYLINIKDIDRAAKATALKTIDEQFRAGTSVSELELLPRLADAIAEKLVAPLRSVLWRLSPTFSLEYDMHDRTHALLRQQFDFAAAHRLHAPELSDEENERVFGKCNNPSGHGHNYRIEAAVAVPVDQPVGGFGLADLEELCDTLVIERFDHTHLNVDTEEFGPRGVMPSVENIAKVIYDILAPAVADRGAALRSMTVWETDRTCCTYPASLLTPLQADSN